MVVAHMGWLAQQLLPVITHLARAFIQQTHDGSQRAGFARTVAPHQRHNLAAIDFKTQALNDVAVVVPGVELIHFEHVHFQL